MLLNEVEEIGHSYDDVGVVVAIVVGKVAVELILLMCSLVVDVTDNNNCRRSC